MRRAKRRDLIDSKVIPGESLVPQHRVCVVDLSIERKKKRQYRRPERINIWELKDKDTAEYFKTGSSCKGMSTGNARNWRGVPEQYEKHFGG